MSTPGELAAPQPSPAPPPFRTIRDASLLLFVAAGAWAGTIVVAQHMGGLSGMTGTMGLTLLGFVGTWTLMMAAMMLPSVAPTASLYAKTVRTDRAVRITGLVVGYLAVWAVAGLPAYGLAWLAGRLATAHPTAAHVLAVAIFAVCGIYQFTWLKDRCLANCRSPLGLLLRYGSYRGPTRDLRAGIHNGGYCLGCCWGLMVILVAVGVMNLFAMVALAALVLIEKVWTWGPSVGRLAGVAALGLALATIWVPWLAPGLYAVPQMQRM
jgi:predicted metal-binding membrane protein